MSTRPPDTAPPSAHAMREAEAIWRFGPFELHRPQRLLLADGKPVQLGARTFDLLVILAGQAGQAVPRDTLLARLWPGAEVNEASLRMQIYLLRKALSCAVSSFGGVETTPGGGYRLVADTMTPITTDEPAFRSLPSLPAQIIGRGDLLDSLEALLPARRFVSLVGPGGIGKTTAAVALAQRLQSARRDGVFFVDLAPLSAPQQLPSALAAALGIPVPAGAPLPVLAEHLRTRQALILLDNCEHVIDAAATLAEHLAGASATLWILTTSREALNVRGEVVQRITPLDTPEQGEALTTASALQIASVGLFVTRARERQAAFRLTDDNLGGICALCRALDGIPLAIEFAAGQAATLGLDDALRQLGDRLDLRGQHGAVLPRHMTVRTLLDWSHGLLNEAERSVFRRLGVFSGAFTLEAACSVAAGPELLPAETVQPLLGLAAKSLLSVDHVAGTPHYRLLETTRDYALHRLHESGEHERIRQQHASALLSLLTEAEPQRDGMSRQAWLSTYARWVDDLRAATEWCFRAGEFRLGIGLTSFGDLLFHELGLADELRPRFARALAHVHELSPPAPLLELRIITAWSGIGSQSTDTQALRTLQDRAIELAAGMDDRTHRLAPLFSMWVQSHGAGHYTEALDAAQRMTQLTQDGRHVPSQLCAERATALTRHYLGDHATCRSLAERVLAKPPAPQPLAYLRTMPQAVSMRIVLSRTLWMQGHPGKAWLVAEEALAKAPDETPYALAHALAIATIPLAIWSEQDTTARLHIERLAQHARRCGSAYWASWARNYSFALDGEGMPPACLSLKEQDTMATLHTGFVTPSLVERIERGDVGWCAPEVLRRCGDLALARDDLATAASRFSQALHLARRQGATAWALRAANSLALMARTHPTAITDDPDPLVADALSRLDMTHYPRLLKA